MGYAIETEDLSKSFGTVQAVRDLNLRVEVGEVFGFLGPNGSGKSTTIKMFLDEIRPTTGRVTILGRDAHVDLVDLHHRVGYLPGDLSLPGQSTGGQYLDFLASLRRGAADATTRDDLIARFDLDPTRKIGQLSSGNRQKIGLVQAFMHQPELVLLDEPTAGLDPLVQHDFHQLLGELANQGTTIFLSSHTLSEIDRVANRVGIVRHGELVAVDTVASLKSRARRQIDIEFEHPPTERLDNAHGVVECTVEGRIAAITLEGPVDDLLRRALGAGTIVSIFSPDADLEDVFLDFYRSKESGSP